MTSSTDWKKVIEDNRDAIEGKMVELHREMANNNPNVHVCLGIEPDGTLFTWTWVGTEPIPESIWNKTDFRITKFSAWDWADNDPNLLEAALYWSENEAEQALIKKRFYEESNKEEQGKTPLEILTEEFPELYKEIEKAEIEAWMDNYKEIASDLVDCIIEQIQ